MKISTILESVWGRETNQTAAHEDEQTTGNYKKETTYPSRGEQAEATTGTSVNEGKQEL